MASNVRKIFQRYRRWILYAYAFVTVSCAAGTVYGWPALRRTLKQEGSTLSEEEFGAIFTVGAWSAQGIRFFLGILRDRLGTRKIAVLSLLCCLAGFASMAWCDRNDSIALGISMFVIGMGAGLVLCLLPIAGLFPDYAGTIQSSLSGAFQISGLVFLVLTEIGTRQATFTGFCFILAGLALLAMILLPDGNSFLDDRNSDKEEKEVLEESEMENQSKNRVKSKMILTGTYDNKQATSEADIHVCEPLEFVESEKGIEVTKGPDCNLQKEELSETSVIGSTDEQSFPTLRQQMLTLECFLLSAWFACSVLPLQYYVGSIGFQLEDRGDDGLYTTLYSVFYSSAAVFSPLGGWIADKYGLALAEAFGSLLCAASFFVLASNRISLNGQIASLILYGLGRMFVFGIFFAHVGKRFGYQNYGTLAGLGLITSALLSLVQYPMIAAAANGLAQEMNLLSGTIFVCMLPYFAWLWRKEVYG